MLLKSRFNFIMSRWYRRWRNGRYHEFMLFPRKLGIYMLLEHILPAIRIFEIYGLMWSSRQSIQMHVTSEEGGNFAFVFIAISMTRSLFNPGTFKTRRLFLKYFCTRASGIVFYLKISTHCPPWRKFTSGHILLLFSSQLGEFSLRRKDTVHIAK